MKLQNFILNFFPKPHLGNYSEFNFENKLLTPSHNGLNSILSWPPNVFLILYSIIEYTDKYRLLVSPQPHFSWDSLKRIKVMDICKSLDSSLNCQLNSSGVIHDKNFLLKKSMDCIFNKNNFNKNIYDLMNDELFCESVFLLLVSIDSFFKKNKSGEVNVNIKTALIKRNIRKIALSRNKENINSSNLADNHDMEGLIAQKYNTPQAGLTMNNLTQNLTYIKPSIKYHSVINKSSDYKVNKKEYNILFIPWPFIVKEEYFTPSVFITPPHDIDNYFGFFDYKPDLNFSHQHFLSYILSTIKRVGSLELIIFPETALSQKQFNNLQTLLIDTFGENAPSLLSGVYGNNDGIGENYALLSFIEESGNGFDTIRQDKHHRWFLERNQLRNYNLASSLDPNKKWWENIAIGRRKLTTLHTNNGVSLCPLVCEDLARQEPVAQAVRSIGPNLVVSLLLDGPQISSRWPGKYSAVLSDDPGSSVLSVTAFGMTQRSTGLGFNPSNQVALWSEPGKGSETLEVPSVDHAIVLELEIDQIEMWSLDGRCEKKPILRKRMHSTIALDTSHSVMALKQGISKFLSSRRSHV
ncbi:carbon-nitrogen hydrolase family protein [Yersinia enterocolitica]